MTENDIEQIKYDICDDLIYLIYAYEELKTHSVYVGLTNNINRRDKEHRNKIFNDSLFRFCKQNDVDIPVVKILKSNLTSTTARKYEYEFWHKYKEDGWNMINCESALGYLGGNCDNRWTEQRIRNFLIEHPEIKMRGQLNDISRSAYRNAQILGILDDLFGEVKCKPYKREDIYNFVKNHPEVKTREQLRDAGAGVYKAAWKFGMLDELFGDSLVKEHTEEELRQYLKEHPEIKRRTDLFNANRQMHHVAEKLGLLEELFGDRQLKPYTIDEVIDYMKKHPEIKTRRELDKKCNRIYGAAKKFGILQDLFGDSLNKSYTEEEVRDYMRNHPEIKRIKDLNNVNPKMLNSARKHNIVDELFPIKYKRAENYTEDDLRQYLKEHPEIDTRKKLLKHHKKLYYLARTLKLFKKYFEDGRFLNRKWTKETIIQYLKDNPDIKRKVDLMNKQAGAYYRAYKLKILDELFPNNNEK